LIWERYGDAADGGNAAGDGEAEVGMTFRRGPTVNRLEKRARRFLGKRRRVVPTGCMETLSASRCGRIMATK